MLHLVIKENARYNFRIDVTEDITIDNSGNSQVIIKGLYILKGFTLKIIGVPITTGFLAHEDPACVTDNLIVLDPKRIELLLGNNDLQE